MDDIIGRVKEGDLLIIYLDNEAEINTKIRYREAKMNSDEKYEPYQNALYYDGMNYHVIPEGEK